MGITFVRAALTVHRDAMPEQHYGYLWWTRDYKTPYIGTDKQPPCD
jgi:hypothetical protein